MARSTRKQNSKKSQAARVKKKYPKLGHKIAKLIRVHPEDFSLELRFSDGYQGTVSLRHLFAKPKGLASEILRGNFFDQCFLESGVLAWPNGFELCSDAVRQWMHEQQMTLKNRAA